MKKKIVAMLALSLTIIPSMFKMKAKASGGEYMSYSEINFENEDKKFIMDYTDEELEPYYKMNKGKRFSGWNVTEINKHEKVTYTLGTVFMYRNEGTTGTNYKFEYKEEEIAKRSFSVTGNLNITISKTIKKLKFGLDDKLKIEYSQSDTVTTRTTWSTNTTVDPNTLLVVKIKGEGYIDSGVAEKYFFWVKTHKGAYEIFNITTEYYSMEKVAI